MTPVIFLLFYFAIVPYLGQYSEKYQAYGTPFETNMAPQPMPHLFEKTYVARPGITSIVDSYLTFRYKDLLLVPINTTLRAYDYSLQRTSLWTQLYARAYFAHYDQYPKSWQSRDRFILYLGRFIYILALLPTALGLSGFLKTARSLFEPAILKPVAYGERWTYFLTVCGFFFFIILYTLRIRDFSTMKAVFLFPAMMAFAYILADGMETIRAKVKSKRIDSLMNAALGSLVLLGCVDILFLIGQLAGALPGK
jgi:hypothetical protein